MANPNAQALGQKLLAWLAREGRGTLPWRDRPAGARDPYRVWLAEVMLQQTTVATVKPYFEAFTKRWPTVMDLANAVEEDVLAQWSGLGYYRRARNLHKAACEVAANGGAFPRTEDELRALTGVGDYTAAAIAAIAYNIDTVPVDGNVERVITRVRALSAPLPKARQAIREHALKMLPLGHAGDFAEALMDLGATICTPKNPKCSQCPLQTGCAGQGEPHLYPVKPAKKAKQQLYSASLVMACPQDGAVLLTRRPEEGLLASMLDAPSTPWRAEPPTPQDLMHIPLWPLRSENSQAPRLMGHVRHIFTHIDLDIAVYRLDSPHKIPAPEGYKWLRPADLSTKAVPTLLKKILTRADRTQG
jgi:A/G-specific adenine glycosylase